MLLVYNLAMKRIFLYSHGFATRADDNGLFNPIIEAFPDDEHILFPYDNWNETNDCAVAATFSERAEKLHTKYNELRNNNPDTEIILICHSQGCIIAALAQLEYISTTVLLAPVINYESGEKQREYTLSKKTSELQDDSSIVRKRSGGYTTIIPTKYWDDFVNISDLPAKYDELANKTRLIIIDAEQDSVIPTSKDYLLLKANIEFKHLPLDHDFIEADNSRASLISLLKKLL